MTKSEDVWGAEARAYTNRQSGGNLHVFTVYDVGDFESATTVSGARLIKKDYNRKLVVCGEGGPRSLRYSALQIRGVHN